MHSPNPSSRFALLRTTLRLLYRSNRRAFVVGAVASLAELLYYPALILLLQQLFQRLTGPQGGLQFSGAVIPIGVGLLVLMLIQRIGIIVRDVANTILRQEAWVVISKQIMQKLPSVPYSLFENNAFQARYGLVIREASHRSITLVDSLLSTAPILLGILGLVITLFSIAPLMVIALLVIAIPATLIERRFSRAMYELQEHSAPMQLRIEALTNMQVDATWQRDVRVYHSNLLGREHATLAEMYLSQLKHVTLRFFGLRSAAVLVQVIGGKHSPGRDRLELRPTTGLQRNGYPDSRSRSDRPTARSGLRRELQRLSPVIKAAEEAQEAALFPISSGLAGLGSTFGIVLVKFKT